MRGLQLSGLECQDPCIFKEDSFCFIVNYACMFVSMGLCVFVSIGTRGVQKRAPDALELELQSVTELWVLHKSSVSLTHCAASSAPGSVTLEAWWRPDLIWGLQFLIVGSSSPSVFL